MFTRVVRFTDVNAERAQALVARIEGNEGPPEGVNATGITLLHDADQGTLVVLQRFASAQDMEAGAKVLAAIDPGETPGTRASVDACEVMAQRDTA